ncbi:MAG: hypothetical protein K0U23_08535 [Gammaproteobacteria bacterium]|nr:hypothetical protein [Gammaproteobacteria bacterium]
MILAYLRELFLGKDDDALTEFEQEIFNRITTLLLQPSQEVIKRNSPKGTGAFALDPSIKKATPLFRSALMRTGSIHDNPVRKILVLNDDIRIYKKLSEVMDLLDNLLKAGFELYAIDWGVDGAAPTLKLVHSMAQYIEACPIEDVDDDAEFQLMPLMESDTLQRLMKSNGIPPALYQELNYSVTRFLLATRHYYVGRYFGGTFRRDERLSRSMLCRDLLDLTELIEIVAKDRRLLETLRRYNPELSEVRCRGEDLPFDLLPVRHLDLVCIEDDGDETGFSAANRKAITSITGLTSLTFSIDDSPKENYLQELLANNLPLRSLNIISSRNDYYMERSIVLLDVMTRINLPHLSEFNCRLHPSKRSTLMTKTVAEIVRGCADTLQFLKVIGLERPFEKFYMGALTDTAFQHLSEITFDTAYLPTIWTKTLVVNAKVLQSFRLNGVDLGAGHYQRLDYIYFDHLMDESFSELVVFDVQHTYLSGVDVDTILKCSSKLRRLIFDPDCPPDSVCVDIGGIGKGDAAGYDFKALRSIKLGSTVPDKLAHKIFLDQYSPSRVTLHFCDSGIEHLLRMRSISQIEYLHIAISNHRFNDLLNLLPSMHMLRELTVNVRMDKKDLDEAGEKIIITDVTDIGVSHVLESITIQNDPQYGEVSLPSASIQKLLQYVGSPRKVYLCHMGFNGLQAVLTEFIMSNTNPILDIEKSPDKFSIVYLKQSQDCAVGVEDGVGKVKLAQGVLNGKVIAHVYNHLLDKGRRYDITIDPGFLKLIDRTEFAYPTGLLPDFKRVSVKTFHCHTSRDSSASDLMPSFGLVRLPKITNVVFSAKDFYVGNCPLKGRDGPDEIAVSNVCTRWQDLVTILRRVPAVRYLNIRYSRIPSDFLYEDDELKFPLLQLDKLFLLRTTMDFHVFWQVVSNAPQLEEMCIKFTDLDGRECLKGFQSYPEVALTHLSLFVFSGRCYAPILKRLLLTILLSASKIDCISIDNIAFDEVAAVGCDWNLLSESNVRLTNLDELTLPDTPDWRRIGACIQACAPALKEDKISYKSPENTRHATAGRSNEMGFVKNIGGGHGINGGPASASPSYAVARKQPPKPKEILRVDNPRHAVIPLDSDAPPVDIRLWRSDVHYLKDLIINDQDIIFPKNRIPDGAEILPVVPYCQSEGDMLVKMAKHRRQHGDCHYYEVHFKVRPGEQPLSTRTAMDDCIAVLEPEIKPTFYYCPKRKQYYLRSESECELRYVIASPKVAYVQTVDSSDYPDHRDPAYEHALAAYEAELAERPGMTITEKTLLMQKYKVGACAERSLACLLDKTKNPAGKKMRYVANTIHAMVEGEDDVLTDLGGYAADYEEVKPPRKTLKELYDQCQLSMPTQPHQYTEPAKAGAAPAERREDVGTTSSEKKSEPGLAAAPALSESMRWLNQIKGQAALKQCWTFNSADATQQAAEFLLSEFDRQQHCTYFVNSPNDMQCLVDHLLLAEAVDAEQSSFLGSVAKKPSGPFADFLRAKKWRTLIINWDHFKPEEVAKYLGLLDNHQQYQKVGVSDGLRCMSLQNVDSIHAYRSADFTTRHDIDHPCPVTQFDRPVTKPSDPDKARPIQHRVDLYSSVDWERYLFGAWRLTDKGFIFEATALFNDLKAGRPCDIQIINPPIDDLEFDRIKTLLQNQHKFYFKGMEWDKVSVTIAQVVADQVLWSKRASVLQQDRAEVEREWVINSEQLCHFVGENRIVEGQLFSAPGVFEEYQGRHVKLFVSHTLSEAEWALLLDTALRFKVSVSLSLAPSVTLPHTIDSSAITSKPAVDRMAYAQVKEVIKTDNIAASIRQLATGDGELPPQTVTGQGIHHIFFEFTGRINLDECKVDRCEILKGNIISALLEGGHVRLVGTLTEEVSQFLATIIGIPDPYIIINGVRHAVKGTVTLITDCDVPYYPYVTTQLHHRTPVNNALLYSQRLVLPVLPQRHELVYAGTLTDERYDNCRIALEGAFKKSNVAVLVGTTGAGKTTFMHQLDERRDYRVFWGLKRLGDFLKYDDENAILFVDEANLREQAALEILMDMQQPKPCIWINRRPFFPKGKIVFAANPADFGSRSDDCQVLNSAEVIMFDSIPLSVLYENSVLPILNKTSLSDVAKVDIGLYWMRLYHCCLASQPGKPVISPRELETIALSFAAAYERAPGVDPLELAKSIGYLFASTLVSEDQLEELKPESFELMPLPNDVCWGDGSKYVFVEEYQRAWTLLNHLVAAIDFNNRHKLNKQVIRQLELLGPSNIGKSDFLRAAMHVLGRRVALIDPSMLLDTQKELLIEAAAQGVAVVHDEANMKSVQGSFEEVLNPHLNGEDLDGCSLNNEFIYLSSGNPPEFFEGRCERTFAEQRRQVALPISELSYESKQKLRSRIGLRQLQEGRLTAMLGGVVLPRPAPTLKQNSWMEALFGRRQKGELKQRESQSNMRPAP